MYLFIHIHFSMQFTVFKRSLLTIKVEWRKSTILKDKEFDSHPWRIMEERKQEVKSFSACWWRDEKNDTAQWKQQRESGTPLKEAEEEEHLLDLPCLRQHLSGSGTCDWNTFSPEVIRIDTNANSKLIFTSVITIMNFYPENNLIFRCIKTNCFCNLRSQKFLLLIFIEITIFLFVLNFSVRYEILNLKILARIFKRVLFTISKSWISRKLLDDNEK